MSSLRTWRVQASFWPTLGVLVALLFGFENTRWDVIVQDHLFDFSRQRWVVDAQAPLPRALFYTGPKVLLITFGLFVLAVIAVPGGWSRRLRQSTGGRRSWVIIFLCLAAVPSFVGWLKATTHVFCPADLRRYGGEQPYKRITDCYAPGERSAARGRCFPAGHASGGFALFALVGLARSRRGQLLGWSIGAGVGLLMGGYQMAKGAHFLSHTLVSALLAWLMFLAFDRIIPQVRQIVTVQ